MGYKAPDRLVQPDGAAQVAMQHAVPIVQILPPQRLIEEVLVAQRIHVGLVGAFAEHLQDGIARNQMDEQEHERDNQPYDGNREREASEGLLHFA
jgi:hypothetical protein